MASSFEEFLKDKNQLGKPLDWVKRKNDWISSVNSFYNNVNDWFEPFISQSLMSVKRKGITVYEEYLGTYIID